MSNTSSKHIDLNSSELITGARWLQVSNIVYAKYNCTLFAVEIVDRSVSAVQGSDLIWCCCTAALTFILSRRYSVQGTVQNHDFDVWNSLEGQRSCGSVCLWIQVGGMSVKLSEHTESIPGYFVFGVTRVLQACCWALTRHDVFNWQIQHRDECGWSWTLRDTRYQAEVPTATSSLITLSRRVVNIGMILMIGFLIEP